MPVEAGLLPKNPRVAEAIFAADGLRLISLAV
jgi:hypothetical protein